MTVEIRLIKKLDKNALNTLTSDETPKNPVKPSEIQ